jgi:uncharacterized membrane protein
MVSSAIGMATIMIAIDRALKPELSRILSLLYSVGPEGARSVLSTIAGSMITVAGVAFSITIVALTLASSQFGSRLLRNFMRDTSNQVVLGTFISTFIYCLLVLRSVRTVGEHIFVPGLSVNLAMVIALGNVGVLIYFIHHISISIQADRIISAVYSELLENLERLFPQEIGYEIEEIESDLERHESEEDDSIQSYQIKASESGYLQAIDSDSLLEIARVNNLLIDLTIKPGDYTVTGNTLATAKCNTQFDENQTEQILGSLIVGPHRTLYQDAEFSVHQLVEVAIRALSPGINDPFTAISCIDRLGSALCFLTKRTFPSSRRYDSEGHLRVITKPVTFAGITNASFDQIRQYGRSSAAVTIRLLETFTRIASNTHNEEQKKAIQRQADMVKRVSEESLPEENDRQDVRERYAVFIEVLSENATYM